ncbi:MAG: hypothetical protein Tsb0032_18170 [Kiloniellaceae bacterium]
MEFRLRKTLVDFRSLSLKQLRAFAATIRTGSVTQAASDLFVTPPAVTTHLKSLEKIVGQPVYQRNAEGPEPTEVVANCWRPPTRSKR